MAKKPLRVGGQSGEGNVNNLVFELSCGSCQPDTTGSMDQFIATVRKGERRRKVHGQEVRI